MTIYNESISDSAAGSDSIAFAATFPVSDSAAGSDDVAFAATFPVGDSAAGSDSLVFGQGFAVSDSAVLSDAATMVILYKLLDGLTVSDALSYTWTIPFSDGVSLGDTMSGKLTVAASLSDSVTVNDVLTVIRSFFLADSVAVDDTPELYVRVLLAAADAMAVSGLVSSRLQAFQLVAETVVVSDEAEYKFLIRLADSADMSDLAGIVKVQYLMALMDSVDVSDSISRFRLVLPIRDDVEVDDTLTAAAQIKVALNDGVVMGGILNLDGEAYEAFVMNTETLGSWKYTNYPFTGFTECNGEYFGIHEGGVMKLTGDTDNGTNIDAVVRTGLLDFGSRNVKSNPRAYLLISKEGEMLLKVYSTSGGKKKVNWYASNDPTNAWAETAPDNFRVKLQRGVKAALFGYELRNVDGADFDVREWDVFPMNLGRKI